LLSTWEKCHGFLRFSVNNTAVFNTLFISSHISAGITWSYSSFRGYSWSICNMKQTVFLKQHAKISSVNVPNETDSMNSTSQRETLYIEVLFIHQLMHQRVVFKKEY
jgi:hypothetical protein